MSSLVLQGRHAVVTGGGSGIGAAIVRRLAEAGAPVTLIGRDEVKLRAVAQQLAASCIVVADVSDPEAVAGAFVAARAALGPVSLLINNAGFAPSAPFLKTSPKTWNDVLGVNLLGAVNCAREALPDMMAAGDGRIVNVASTAALKGYAYVVAYVAAKHGLLGFTRALALEVARKGVTVNAVCPGYTDTDLIARSIETITGKTGMSAEDARAQLAAANPQARLVTPDEVAAAVTWLCLPEAASINGAALPISGGEV